MAEKERINESIKYQVELIRLVWVSILGLSGGALGLLTNVVFTTATAKIILAGLGIAGSITLGFWLMLLDRGIRSLIDTLKEVE